MSARARDSARLLWRVVTRFWSARALAEAGVRVPPLIAAASGHVAVGVIGVLCLHALLWTIGEPYQDFWAVLPNQRFLINLSMCAAVLGIPLYLLACASAFVRWGNCATSRRQREATAQVVLLSPLVTFVPLLAWLPFGTLRDIADPGLQVGVAKPAWAAWALWPIAGSLYWLIALAALWLIQLLRAIPLARELTRDPSGCAACGYPLAGIPSGMCPECGRRREPIPALPAKRTEAGP